jgi:hypothetical protein
MPFSDSPVFQLSPRDAQCICYAPLLSQTYFTFRAFTATLPATKTEWSNDQETETTTRHRSHGSLYSNGAKTIDDSPHERFFASQRIKRKKAALDEPRLVRLPTLTEARSQRFYAPSEPDPKIPSYRHTRFLSPWQHSQASCLQGITECRDPALFPKPCLPCR